MTGIGCGNVAGKKQSKKGVFSGNNFTQVYPSNYAHHIKFSSIVSFLIYQDLSVRKSNIVYIPVYVTTCAISKGELSNEFIHRTIGIALTTEGKERHHIL